MTPPRPPASSGFNCIGECDRRKLCNRPRSPQHGDVMFLSKTNLFCILLTIILLTKGMFFKLIYVIFYWPLRRINVH
jgi:hypothetical protein